MSVEIKTVKGSRDLHKFLQFRRDLFKGQPSYVPALLFDELNTLNPKTNPAASFCESELYLAYKDGRLVGKIAAIVNKKANEAWNHNEVRFGWPDFIDDPEVSKALVDKVIEFGKVRGMDTVVGPLGFTDFDPEGMLVEGFDKLSTMAMLYNLPYYPRHFEAMGFGKETDWIEYKIFIPDEINERYLRMSKVVEERSHVRIVPLTKEKIRKENFARKLFNLINECYKNLYNYTVMPDDLADKYIGFYLSVLDLKYISIIENDKNEIVGFGICMPSLAKALQKTSGKLFPFGWYHILKAMKGKGVEGADMLLIGIRPDYQNQGLNCLLFCDVFKKFKDSGFKWAETQAILEDNLENLTLWRDFDKESDKRRRIFTKKID
ncbi:MAG: N-acetyltransferase [Bacteroidales bacterium]|nr:N-acetyltransferase [Bacteroidales bacterium]